MIARELRVFLFVSGPTIATCRVGVQGDGDLRAFEQERLRALAERRLRCAVRVRETQVRRFNSFLAVIAVVVAPAAAAQESLCNPCVDPPVQRPGASVRAEEDVSGDASIDAARNQVPRFGVGAVGSSASVELDNALASMRRAMVGHWSGAIAGTDASGRAFEVEDAFTFVVTSDDGLDSATWSAETLEIATYEGNGRYRIRNWNSAGRQGTLEYTLRIVEGPDSRGNGTWVLEFEQPRADGAVMESRECFTLHEDALEMRMEVRPAGSGEPFETVVTGTWNKASN